MYVAEKPSLTYTTNICTTILNLLLFVIAVFRSTFAEDTLQTDSLLLRLRTIRLLPDSRFLLASWKWRKVHSFCSSGALVIFRLCHRSALLVHSWGSDDGGKRLTPRFHQLFKACVLCSNLRGLLKEKQLIKYSVFASVICVFVADRRKRVCLWHLKKKKKDWKLRSFLSPTFQKIIVVSQ